ncbi:hypothetical protein D1007_23195 [Hordeum vulgare]|nr:hypothetical protein D1007_23195 [Hordeum vulgare]
MAAPGRGPAMWHLPGDLQVPLDARQTLAFMLLPRSLSRIDWSSPELWSPSPHRSRIHHAPLIVPRRPRGPPPLTSSIPGIKSSGAASYTLHRARLCCLHHRPPSLIASSPVHLRPRCLILRPRGELLF